MRFFPLTSIAKTVAIFPKHAFFSDLFFVNFMKIREIPRASGVLRSGEALGHCVIARPFHGLVGPPLKPPLRPTFPFIKSKIFVIQKKVNPF